MTSWKQKWAHGPSMTIKNSVSKMSCHWDSQKDIEGPYGDYMVVRHGGYGEHMRLWGRMGVILGHGVQKG